MAKLRLVPASGEPVEIASEQVIVGRDPSCDLLLSDGSVSRKHAYLERRGPAWAVVDQGSANGTFVDSQRVADSVLRSGQELRFGAVAFRVEIESEAPDTTLLPQPEATVIQPAVVAPPPAPAPPPPRTHAQGLPPLPGSQPASTRPAGGAPPPPPPPPPRAGASPRFPPATAGLPAPAATPGAAGASPRKGKSPLFWVGTGCCGCLTLVALVVGLIAFSAFFLSAEPVNAVRAQLTDIKEGRLDEAYGRFSQSYQAQVSREEFELLVARHPALRENADATFLQRSVSGDTARISGFLASASGQREPVSYELVKEGGSWKIANVNFGE